VKRKIKSGLSMMADEETKDTIDKKNEFKGAYLGTVVEGRWWKRYMKDGFFMRGAGLGKVEDDGFYFRRYMTKKPLFISYKSIVGTGFGDWHGGKWAVGRLILKIEWKKDEKEDKKLCSGFLFEDDEITRKIREEIEMKMTKMKITNG